MSFHPDGLIVAGGTEDILLSAAVLIRIFDDASHHAGSQLFHQFLESSCASPGPHSSMAWLEDKSVIIWDVKNEQARCAAFRDSHFP